MDELTHKLSRIRNLLEESHLDALLLQRVSSFAWATCGAASFVNSAATMGEASLLVTPKGRYLISNNIEATRLEQEEGLKSQGWEFLTSRWDQPKASIEALTKGMHLGADSAFPGAVDLSSALSRMRAELTPEEGQRFRELGRLCAASMNGTIRSVRTGQTEHEIAARLAHESQLRGVQAIVNLIAADERVFAFRHPLPTSKRLERYAMLVLCGRRWGLVCSITRLVHFGRLPRELREKAEAVAQVDAAFISATRPGSVLGQVFQRSVEHYAAQGYPDEWHLHHQGGPAGYEPREYLATSQSPEVVLAGQAYAWNPSITGAKSEDTILVGEAGNEILTHIPGWPEIVVKANGAQMARPAILEVE